MTIRSWHRFLALAAAWVLIPLAAETTHAQAWVPEPGTGLLSVDYQVTNVKWHLFSQDVTAFGGEGERADLGRIDAQTGVFSGDYGVARNLAFTASVAYVGAKYRGTFPESDLDDGKFRGGLQDASLGVRYMIPWQGFAVTPNLGYSFPTHEYEHHGHAAIGRGNSSLNAGLAVGRTLDPWIPNVWLQGSYTRSFVPDVEQWGLDVNTFSGAVGWFILPQLSISGNYTYLETEDGIDWYWDDFGAPGVEHNHDRAAQALARRVGGAVSYQFNATHGVFASVSGVLSGVNTHDFMSYTVGTNWNFSNPFAD
jgi:hypothetical protein